MLLTGHKPHKAPLYDSCLCSQCWKENSGRNKNLATKEYAREYVGDKGHIFQYKEALSTINSIMECHDLGL